MAKLTYKQKKSFPASTYGLPKEKKYPMPDKAHARSAKSYASKEEHAGKLSPSQKATIDRKANAKLGKGKRK